MDEEGRVSGLQGFRDFLNNITHGTFREDSNIGSDDDRLDAEFYTEFSSPGNSLGDDEDEDSSGEDNEREINLHPEVDLNECLDCLTHGENEGQRDLPHETDDDEYIENLVRLFESVENEYLQGSSPDYWADDEHSTSQQASGEENEELPCASDDNKLEELPCASDDNEHEELPCASDDNEHEELPCGSDDNEQEEAIPHGENRMENHLLGSPPHSWADGASSQRASGEESDNELVGELTHEGNQRKRKLPHESDHEDVDILSIWGNKRKPVLCVQSDENNFTERSPTGYRSQQMRGEDKEGGRMLPPDEDNDNIQSKLD